MKTESKVIRNKVGLLQLAEHGTEYCGASEHHEHQLYLAIEDIDHTKTTAKVPRPMAFVSVSTGPFRMNFMQ